jgi:hypothetical protein
MGGESAPFKAQTSYGIYTDHIKRLLSSSGSVPIQHVQYAGREKLQVTMTQGYVIKTTYSSALRNKKGTPNFIDLHFGSAPPLRSVESGSVPRSQRNWGYIRHDTERRSCLKAQGPKYLHFQITQGATWPWLRREPRDPMIKGGPSDVKL